MLKPSIQAKTVYTVKVIRNSSDASLDYYLDRVRAKQLYDEGKLHWDLTNHAYCTPTIDRVD